jgi:hypothetical protein
MMGRQAGRSDRLARLAGEMGLDLPVFEGPLCAFQIGEASGVGVPIYLGGDLHGVHPEGGDVPFGPGRDPSLDSARITVDDHEHEPVGVTAVEGIWCLALPEGLYYSAPYFSIIDARGRLRAWLFLPPAHAMIGMAHLWFPQVPPVMARPQWPQVMGGGGTVAGEPDRPPSSS